MTTIQVRGTNGSGKTTVMRSVLSSLPDMEPVFIEKRRNPIYYTNGKVAILGHYVPSATGFGGADTIKSIDGIFQLMRELSETHRVVMAEGAIVSEDKHRTLTLIDPKILFLITPVDECLDRIKRRRERVGVTEPLNPKRTISRAKTIEKARLFLEENGVYCRRASCRQALGILQGWIQEALR